MSLISALLCKKRNNVHNSGIVFGSGFANGQKREPYRSLRYGLSRRGFSSCGVLAAYNALLASGLNAELAQVTAALERCALFFGLFGVNPFMLPHRLKRFGAELSRVSFDEIAAAADESVFIITYFTKPRPTLHMHTVCSEKRGGVYRIYNRYSDIGDVYTLPDICGLITAGQYITGYRVLNKL